MTEEFDDNELEFVKLCKENIKIKKDYNYNCCKV